MSTSEARGALSSPSNQLIFPCLCYWSLLYTPFCLLPLAELIRTVNTVYNLFFCLLLSFYLDRQLRRILKLLSEAIMSLPTILFVLPVIRAEVTIMSLSTILSVLPVIRAEGTIMSLPTILFVLPFIRAEVTIMSLSNILSVLPVIRAEGTIMSLSTILSVLPVIRAEVTIMSLRIILFALPVIRAEGTIPCYNSKYGQKYLLLLASCKFVSHVTKQTEGLF